MFELYYTLIKLWIASKVYSDNFIYIFGRFFSCPRVCLKKVKERNHFFRNRRIAKGLFLEEGGDVFNTTFQDNWIG
jgi:hypothetical protein